MRTAMLLDNTPSIAFLRAVPDHDSAIQLAIQHPRAPMMVPSIRTPPLGSRADSAFGVQSLDDRRKSTAVSAHLKDAPNNCRLGIVDVSLNV